MENTQQTLNARKHSETNKTVRFQEEHPPDVVSAVTQYQPEESKEQVQPQERMTNTETLLASNSRERSTHRRLVMNHSMRSKASSALYGAYTRRGKGITKATVEKAEIVQLLVKLSTCRPPSRLQMPFSSIQASRTSLRFGSYKHGELWVSSASGHARLPEKLQPIQSRLPASSSRGTWHDIRRKWLVFDGKSWHCSRPYTGQRVSIIFYVASGVHELSSEHHQKLHDLGFVVPDRSHEEQSWLQAVDLKDESYVASQDNASPEKTIIVIAERQRQLIDTLHSHDFHVLRATHAHVKARRALPTDLAMIVQDIKDMRPQLLWIQYQGQAVPGRRAQTRLLHDYFL
eukprot:796340-Amphidinium_carterae.1